MLRERSDHPERWTISVTLLREIAEEATSKCGYGDAVLEEVEAIVLATERRIAALAPTTGRAAEPNTMGEVEKLLQAFDDAAQAHGWESDQGTGDAPEKAEEAWRDAYAALHLAITLTMSDLRTRAETAEAQLATLRAEVEKVKVPDELRELIGRAINRVRALSNPKADR